MEKYSKHTARFLSCAVILMLSACSSTPRLNLLQDSAKVAILSPVVTQQGGALKIHNQAIGGDAKTGVGSGALAGAAVGLSCGPLVIFCAPVGALAGAITGGMTGAVVGSARGLNSKQTESINKKMSAFLQGHNPQENLLAKVVDRGSERWQVIPPPAEREVVVQLSSLGLRTQGGGRVMLAMQATITIRFPGKSGQQRAKTRKFEYESSPTFVDSWIEDNEGFLQLRFDDAYRTLAENIVIALSDR